MEILFICSVIALTAFLSISMALLRRRKSYSSHPNLPPGDMGFPIVGESIHFLNAGRKGHPESFIIDRMAKFCPRVFKTCILGEPTVVLCGVQGNKFLFSNENKLVTAWWPSSVDKIFPSEPDVQTTSQEESLKMRKILPTFLKPEALQRYVGVMDGMAKKHFENCWEGNQKVKVFPLAKRYTFWLACRLFMGIDDPKQIAELEGPFDALAAGIISIPINLPGTSFNKGIKASELVRKQLKEIIKQRKAELPGEKSSPAQDFLSHMLLAKDEDGFPLSEGEIANKILGLLIGGHDTASAAITFVINYLAQLPEIYNLVYAEQMEIAKSKKPGEMLNWEDMQKMKYSWNVTCEVMRLAPPLQGAFREAIHDFDFAGFSIPKGWKLYWTTHSTHRNPEYFPEPEKLDPSRFDGKGPAPYSFVPFGGGPRMCPGKEYARLEILVFIHNLVQRFRWEKVIPSEKVVVDPLPVPAQGLPVLLFPHSPLPSP